MAVMIPDDVKDQLDALPKVDRERIVKALRQVAADINQRQSFVTEMVGQPRMWRLRKGNWRILYRIKNGDIEVVGMGLRKEVYK